MVNLVYGLDKSGVLRHITEVPSGLSCGCVCPHCHTPLVAHKGNVVQPHFAHYSNNECAGAHETELHRLAKAIIAESKTIMLPSYGIVTKAQPFVFDAIEIEQRMDTLELQPDVVGVKFIGKERLQRRLWIEICVFHPVSSEKLMKIQALNLPCIEVYLHRFLDKQADRSELEDFLIKSEADRRWLNNPRADAKLEQKIINNRIIAQRLSILEKRNNTSLLPIEEAYQQEHPEHKLFPYKNCVYCKHNTLRESVKSRIRELRFPRWLEGILKFRVDVWNQPLASQDINGVYYIQFSDNSIKYLPTSPEQYPVACLDSAQWHLNYEQNGRIIHFLKTGLLDYLKSMGNKCHYSIRSFDTQDKGILIACTNPKARLSIPKKPRPLRIF